jgi:ankyrin repeat protein
VENNGWQIEKGYTNKYSTERRSRMFKINRNAEHGVRIVCVIMALFLFLFIPATGWSSELDSALIQAVKDENVPLVKDLLGKGADVNARGEFENTPLIIASKLGNIECVKILLANGAYIDSQCFRKCSPLMWAADNGHIEVVNALIKNGAAPNTQDLDGWTALMKAIYRGQTKIVKVLVENGANVNSTNIGGYTALFIAEEIESSPEIIHILKESGAKK